MLEVSIDVYLAVDCYLLVYAILHLVIHQVDDFRSAVAPLIDYLVRCPRQYGQEGVPVYVVSYVSAAMS